MGTKCLCLLRQTAQTGRVLFARDGVSYVVWFENEVGSWESARKERGRLGNDASVCSLDGGETGRLDKLGVRECVGLGGALKEGVWPEKDE